MNFIWRIGYDAGATPLEDALAAAARHDFHYLDFSADTGPNRLDNWPDDRIGAVRLADNAGAVAVHLPPCPGNIDFPATFRRLESAGYNGYYTMPFGSIADQLAARELVPHLRHLAPDAAAPAFDASRCCWLDCCY